MSAAIEVADLFWVQLHVDHKIFINRQPERTVDTWGLSAVYHVDLGTAVPTVELGLAGIAEKGADEPARAAALVVYFGAGLDFFIDDWLFVGAIFRYYPFLETDLLAPAYAGINGRIGVQLGD